MKFYTDNKYLYKVECERIYFWRPKSKFWYESKRFKTEREFQMEGFHEILEQDAAFLI